MIEHMYLARCDAQLGRKTGSENNWERALEAAGGDAQKLLTLADYAEKNGATAIALRACDGAIAAAPKLRPAWQEKLRLTQAARNTVAIHAVLAGMLQLWPNDTAIQNDEAYLRLLLATAKDEGRKMKDETGFLALEHLAEGLVTHDPRSLPHRTLLALVLLSEGRPYAALEVYRDLNVPPSALTPSALAVHAAVLAATGNKEGAREEAAKIPHAQLLPEERALIQAL